MTVRLFCAATILSAMFVIGCGQGGGAGPAVKPPATPSNSVEQKPAPAEEALPGGGEGARQ